MKNKIVIKVCGLKDPTNINEVLSLGPDYLGFIFYPASARFVGDLDEDFMKSIQGVKKTAVFVNASLENIQDAVDKFEFDAVQLHGDESPEFCEEVKKMGVELIKAFGVDTNFDFNQLADYIDVVDYFLFDTKTSKYGGSGETFDWEFLKKYPYQKQYFLSGGIGLENFMEAYSFDDERLYAIDINSRFEISPGVKNINLLKQIFKIK